MALSIPLREWAYAEIIVKVHRGRLLIEMDLESTVTDGN